MPKTLFRRFAAYNATAIFVLLPCWLPAAEPQFRLPDLARPTRYKLDLTILLSEPTFKGTATISVELKERTSEVWLSAKDLAIDDLKISADEASKAARW
jgi:hypothetical protein